MGVILPNRGGDCHNKGTPLKWYSKNTDVRYGWKLDYESLSTKVVLGKMRNVYPSKFQVQCQVRIIYWWVWFHIMVNKINTFLKCLLYVCIRFVVIHRRLCSDH